MSVAWYLLAVLPYLSGFIFIGFLNYEIASLKFAITTLLMNFFVVWIIVLPVNIPSKLFKISWITLITIIYATISVLDCGSIITVNLPFQQYLVDIIFETNVSEAGEFISTFINYRFITMLFSTWGIAATLYYLCCRYKLQLPKWLSFIGLVCVLMGYAFVIRAPYSIAVSPIYKVSLFLSHRKSFDLREYQTHPRVISSDALPEHIVIIIGESFQATHSNLYGYDKDTTPQLQALYDDGQLYVCKNVKSADLYTYASIIKLLTMAKDIESPHWLNSHKLPDILSAAGYKTSWISNQGTNGASTNIGEKFSQLCDTAVFFSKYISSVSYSIYDDIVLSHLDRFQSTLKSPHAEFIHLMGSHFKYAERYPKDFNKFTSLDYPEYSSSQAKTLAEYDNSLAYNDSIISEIIKHYAAQESMIIYLSDHGQDLFVSDSNYAGHARPQNQISAKEGAKVPFMIFLSKSLRKKNPELSARVDSIMNTSIDLADFPEILMECLKIKLLN